MTTQHNSCEEFKYMFDSGWQASQEAQAEYIAMLELNNKFKDDRIAELTAENEKLREELESIVKSGDTSGSYKLYDRVYFIAKQALKKGEL